jgi:hypothetical protein
MFKPPGVVQVALWVVEEGEPLVPADERPPIATRAQPLRFAFLAQIIVLK